jgi:hypothetical protein
MSSALREIYAWTDGALAFAGGNVGCACLVARVLVVYLELPHGFHNS